MAPSSDGAARQCGGRCQTASSRRLEVLRHRSPPPPRPRRRRPSSSDPVPRGLPAPPPPCQVRLLEPPLSAACSVPYLDHVCTRAQGLQGLAVIRDVHVRGHAEAGAGEQARVDGAMLEVMGADLLHPPRADRGCWPTSTRELGCLGMETTYAGGVRCRRRRRGAGTFRADERSRSCPPFHLLYLWIRSAGGVVKKTGINLQKRIILPDPLT
ncbi:uncharacterized protein LOC119288977 isoform X1 [Triticum dicoccoides]|uniref:uncharacterized protein LOC119288977 isoform X1 n=1 Tax=Triticum dicoccoides TaxID=85692 RepID=UPI00188EC579|nr:uncharacterized protein LOC119288977 isoform X1 [Triticum dicoccoides]